MTDVSDLYAIPKLHDIKHHHSNSSIMFKWEIKEVDKYCTIGQWVKYIYHMGTDEWLTPEEFEKKRHFTFY